MQRKREPMRTEIAWCGEKEFMFSILTWNYKTWQWQDPQSQKSVRIRITYFR